MLNLYFLGGGNMTKAIITPLYLNPNYNLTIIQKNLAKTVSLKQELPKLNIITELDFALNKADLLFLAIKPQDAKTAIEGIKKFITDCTIISIMAGLNIKTLYNLTNNAKLVRIMPNTPVKYQAGISAIYFSSSISIFIQDQIKAIFNLTGQVYLAKKETEIDQIIPITSSGLGFMLYFLMGMEEFAIKDLGFSLIDSKLFLNQIVNGLNSLILNNPELSFSELLAQIMSKGGTTFYGITSFKQENLWNIIKNGMQKSFHRAQELNQELENGLSFKAK